MSGTRNIVLATGEIYHIFNRGIEKRPVFRSSKEYKRCLETVDFYRFAQLPIRYSHFINLGDKRKKQLLGMLTSCEVSVLAFCLLLNHFHFILKQEKKGGISRFVSNITNSYTKFFNTKHERIGPLFQGAFKAVRVETEDQLVHLSRYVHLNPLTGFQVNDNQLGRYPWSSLPEYLNPSYGHISNPELVLSRFKNREEYRKFVHDQINYARELEKVKHLSFEEQV